MKAFRQRTGELTGQGSCLGGGGKQVESQEPADHPRAPGAWPGAHLLPRPVLNAKEPSPPLPNLCPAPQSGSQTSPLQPFWLLSQTSRFFFFFSLLCRVGPQASSLPAPPAPQLGPPPTTCHPPTWNPLCPRWRPPWQALCPEAPLLRGSRWAQLGSQSERFIVVFRGRLGADVIMSVNALCKL